MSESSLIERLQKTVIEAAEKFNLKTPSDKHRPERKAQPETSHDDLEKFIAELESSSAEQIAEKIITACGDGEKERERDPDGLTITAGWRRYAVRDQQRYDSLFSLMDQKLLNQSQLDDLLKKTLAEEVQKEKNEIAEAKLEYPPQDIKNQWVPAIANFLKKFRIPSPEKNLKQTRVHYAGDLIKPLVEHYLHGWYYPASGDGVSYRELDLILVKPPTKDKARNATRSKAIILHEMLHLASAGNQFKDPEVKVDDLDEAIITECQNMILVEQGQEPVDGYYHQRQVLKKLNERIPFETFIKATFVKKELKNLRGLMNANFGAGALERLSKALREQIIENKKAVRGGEDSKKPLPLMDSLERGEIPPG